MPHLFNSSAARYGVVGAVFAMLSALFAAMLALVASAALDEKYWTSSAGTFRRIARRHSVPLHRTLVNK